MVRTRCWHFRSGSRLASTEDFSRSKTMPTLSASDYTTFLKYKAASVSAIKPSIQTRDNVSTNQSVINANLLTSQAAFVATPYTAPVFVNGATVSAASATTVTNGNTIGLTAAVSTNTITYTSSQNHGLVTGDVISVAGISGVTPSANVTDATVTRLSDTTFSVTVTGVSGTPSGTGRIVGRVYYTTSVAHGLTVGMTVTITNVGIFSTTNATVLTVPSATTFALSNTTTGAAVTGATGTINGYVYYTTSAAHGLVAGTQNISVSGLSTSAFNLSLATVGLVPSATVFALVSNASGTAVTGASGVLTTTYFANTNTAIRNNARVQALPVVQTRVTSTAKSTLSWTSGTSGSVGTTTSSKFQQGGGLPASGRVGVYTRLPQGAGWGTNNH
jgi:hypothetical protein